MFLGQAVQAGTLKPYPTLVMIVVSFGFVYFLMSGHFSARKAKKAQPNQG
jgi:preprotein translocase subunit YajC